MPLGETLRKAREAKKLSSSQIAAATHMKMQTVEAIEKEDFSKMPAAIYCKGFIKLYAEHLGLDPDPLTREYVERFVEPPPAVPEPAILQNNEPADLFMPSSPPAPASAPEAPAGEQPATPQDEHRDLFWYGRTRNEEPPEVIFQHKPKERIEGRSPAPILKGISDASAQFVSSITQLSDHIRKVSARALEAMRPEQSPSEDEREEEQPVVDTSPIELPHRRILIISAAAVGAVLLVFAVSMAARFFKSKSGVEQVDIIEKELTLPAPPPPFVD